MLSPTALNAAKWMIPSIILLSKKVFKSLLMRVSILKNAGFFPVIVVIFSKTAIEVFDKSSIMITSNPSFCNSTTV